MTNENDTEDDAPVARGTETMDDIQTEVGEPDMPKVNGTDPALADKDPSDVSLADLGGLDDDEKEAVLEIMSSRDDQELTTDGPSGQDDATPTQQTGVDESGSDGRERDESGSEEDTDDAPEPRTLEETGLLDDDGDFPWEGESLGETSVGEGGVIDKFQYKKTNFEVNEPEDRQRFESNFDSLQGVQDVDDAAKRRSISDRYSQKIARQTLTVEGYEIDDVYRVEHNGTAHVVPDPSGEKGVAHHGGAQPLWDAMTWFDRFKLGMRIGQMVLGERQFQSRID